MSPDSSSRRSHESNEGGGGGSSSRSRRRSDSLTRKRRKYSPSSSRRSRSRSNSPSPRNSSSSRRKYHESSSTNGRSPTRSSRRSPEYSNRKRSYRTSYSSSSHHRRSPQPSSSRRDSERYNHNRNSSSSNNRKPSPPAERRDRKSTTTTTKNDSSSRPSPPSRRARPISSSSSSSPSPSPPPIPISSSSSIRNEPETTTTTLETQSNIIVAQTAAVEIKSETRDSIGFPASFGLISQPPLPPPQPQFNYPPPQPPPFYMLPPPPAMPQLSAIFYPPNPAAQFSMMYPFTPPPPPPPPPIAVEEEAPGTSVTAIPVPIQSSKYLYMPDRPKIRGKVALPRVADDWGHGKIKDYEIIKAVGEGTYGKVFKAKHRSSGTLVALKKVRLENERDGFPITAVREIKILRQLDHENVVRLLDVAIEGPKHDPDGPNIDSFYLVFEYMAHDLHGLIDSKIVDFTVEQISSMVKQLLLGLEHCHTKNFLHRDIKCSNILLNNKGQIKLADFGLARLYHKSIDRLYTNRVITLWYRPPELLLGLEKYGPAVDIWSIGCIIGELFLKRPIFTGQTEQNMLEVISSICGTPSPEVWPGVEKLPLWHNVKIRFYPRIVKDYFRELSSLPLDLLDKLLSLDPSKRPTATEALDHPWIKRININQIPGPDLPDNQDCHEMWSKKMRKSGQTFSTTKDAIPSQHVPPYSNNGSSSNGRSSSQSSYRRSYHL